MDAETLKSIVVGVPIPLLAIDGTSRIAAANEAAMRIFGTGIEGRLYLTVIRQPAIIECIETALRDKSESQGRGQITGTAHDMLFRVMTTPLGKGSALVAIEDVTDAEQASRIRRDFVANVSHEMRTPLTAMLGFIETLRGAARDDAAARERFLTIMAREGERMNRLVEDLLSLTRVESEERIRPTTRIDLAAIVQASLSSLRPLAETANVRLEITGDSAPLATVGDADQITQVITNLTENAIKYGGAGGVVTLHLSREEHEPVLRGPAVRVDVIDRGEGIDEIHLPRLTERFYRVDSHRSREKGGTGLGLAIVKHIVNRHRGRLRIESERGKGSRFSVILPAA